MQRLLKSLQAFLLAAMLMFTAVGSLTIVPDVALADTQIDATQSVLVAEVDKAAIRRGLDAPVKVGENEKMWLNFTPDAGDVARDAAQRCSQIGEYCFRGEGCCPGLDCHPYQGELGLCIPSE